MMFACRCCIRYDTIRYEMLESRHESAYSTARKQQLKSVKTGKKLQSERRICSEVTVSSLGESM